MSKLTYELNVGITGRVWTPPLLQVICSITLGMIANVYPVS